MFNDIPVHVGTGKLKFRILLLQTSGGREVRTGKACHGKN